MIKKKSLDMNHSSLSYDLSVAKKIKQIQRAIRQKTLELKVGNNDLEQEIHTYLKPLRDPLEKIVKLNENKIEKESKVKRRLLDDAHNVLETVKKQRQRMEVLSSSPTTSNEDKNRQERIRKILNSPKLYIKNTTKINPAIKTPEWDSKFDFTSPHSSEPVSDKISTEIPLEQSSSNNEIVNSEIEAIPKNSTPKRDLLSEDLPTKKIENFNTKISTPKASTPNKRDSFSNVNYYMNLLHMHDDRIDRSTGIVYKNNRYELNRIPIKLLETPYKALSINSQRFRLTQGLNELLFMKQPDQKLVSNIDERNYKKIASEAMFTADKKLATLKTTQYLSGQGLLMHEDKKDKEYVYWDDPNELVSRLELLHASRLAGSNSHDNEIISIVEELSERNLIN